MEIYMQSLACLWLLLCSLQDIKSKKISINLISIGFICLAIMSLVFGDIDLWSRIGGLGLGIILLLLNLVTRGQIGLGDGLIISILGICFGFYINASLLLFSLLLSAILSFMLIIFKKADRKKTIPFIPFILLGYLGVLFLG